MQNTASKDRERDIFRMSLNQRISPSLSENIQLQQAPVRKQAGFTLVELLVVFSILSILVGIAVPKFSEWKDNSAVNAATMALFAKYKQARTLAVAENRPVRMVFDDVNDIIVYDDNKGGICSYCKHLPLNLSQFSPSLALIINSNLITFERDGSATSRTIKLGIDGYFKCITVNRIGRAYIHDADSAECLAL
ncbi:MAG TPA: prepilin-type N-terminal cleavage/methylation domain-containing protein [Ghiorsea sp.]|nr:prepilin-type N-terminal cleavage/methylation domain-containing protein [Ghiorsea sp.]